MADSSLTMRIRTASSLITGSQGKTMEKPGLTGKQIRQTPQRRIFSSLRITGTGPCTLKLAGQNGKVLLSNTGEEETGTREISGKGRSPSEAARLR